MPFFRQVLPHARASRKLESSAAVPCGHSSRRLPPRARGFHHLKNRPPFELTQHRPGVNDRPQLRTDSDCPTVFDCPTLSPTSFRKCGFACQNRIRSTPASGTKAKRRLGETNARHRKTLCFPGSFALVGLSVFTISRVLCATWCATAGKVSPLSVTFSASAAA